MDKPPLLSRAVSAVITGVLIIAFIQIPIILFKFTMPSLPATVQRILPPFFNTHPVLSYVTSIITGLAIIAGVGILFRLIVRAFGRYLPVLNRVLDRSEHLELALKGFAAGRRVVLLSWPNPNVRTVAVLSSTMKDESGRELGVVYIPNTPNPLTGIVRVVDMTHVVDTDMKVSDAMTVAVSRGAVMPEKLRIDAVPETES